MWYFGIPTTAPSAGLLFVKVCYWCPSKNSLTLFSHIIFYIWEQRTEVLSIISHVDNCELGHRGTCRENCKLELWLMNLWFFLDVVIALLTFWYVFSNISPSMFFFTSILPPFWEEKNVYFESFLPRTLFFLCHDIGQPLWHLQICVGNWSSTGRSLYPSAQWFNVSDYREKTKPSFPKIQKKLSYYLKHHTSTEL